MKLIPIFLLILRVGLLACFAGLATHLPAQTTATASTAPSPSDSLAAAFQLRNDMVAAIAANSETADAAVTRLKTFALPAEMQGDPDTDYADAAIDVGQRLLVIRKPAEAELFFQAAEDSLTRYIDKTPDAMSQAKARSLRVRAFIRFQFLNEGLAAKADLDAALKLISNAANLSCLQSQISTTLRQLNRISPKS